MDGSVASRHVLNLHLISELFYLVSFLPDCVWMAQSPVAGRRVLNLQLMPELFYMVSFLGCGMAVRLACLVVVGGLSRVLCRELAVRITCLILFGWFDPHIQLTWWRKLRPMFIDNYKTM